VVLVIVELLVGFDSLMLNDFKEIKEWSQRTGWCTQFLSSVAGYCVALVVKTLPQTILRSSHKVHVQVIANDIQNTLWVDHRRGDFVQSCRTSTATNNNNNNMTTNPILYEGETGIIAGSTIPYYGGKLRLFPFARMTLDRMHLRLGRIHPFTGFLNIPFIFNGSFRDRSRSNFGVLDFIGSDFTIHVSPIAKPTSLPPLPPPQSSTNDSNISNCTTTTTTTTTNAVVGFPLQHSGESVGHVSSFRLRVIPTPIRFLSLLPERT
jgi:hypothetical protein